MPISKEFENILLEAHMDGGSMKPRRRGRILKLTRNNVTNLSELIQDRSRVAGFYDEH
jgi:hypothetical protein